MNALQATINVKVNGTTMTLNNVKEGSNVELDMMPNAGKPAAAPAVRARFVTYNLSRWLVAFARVQICFALYTVVGACVFPVTGRVCLLGVPNAWAT